MPRKKKKDLAEFQEWLMRDKFISDSTACTYASNVRAVIGWLDDLQDVKVVERGFRNMALDVSRKMLAARRTAWKHFVEFADVQKNIKLAFPNRLPSHRGPPPLPHAVRGALHTLTRKGIFLQKQIPGLRWSMFLPDVPSLPTLRFNDPYQRGQTLEVARKEYQALREWSGFTAGDDAPLFPVKFGSTTPYPATAFRRELRQYKKDMGPALDPLPALQKAALAEHEEVVAQSQGVKTGLTEITPSHSTAALAALIEGNLETPYLVQGSKRQELPGEAGPTSGAGEPSGREMTHDPLTPTEQLAAVADLES